MAIVQLNSNLLANVYTNPTGQANQRTWMARKSGFKTAVNTTASADTANSQYRVCQVFSGDFVRALSHVNTAFGTSAAMSLGLYKPNSTTAVSSALFALNTTFVSAVTTPVPDRFRRLVANHGAAACLGIAGLCRLIQSWSMTCAGR